MDGTIGARKVFAEPVAPEQRRRGQVPALAVGAIVAVVAPVVLTNPRGSASIALAGGVGLVCLVAAVGLHPPPSRFGDHRAPAHGDVECQCFHAVGFEIPAQFKPNLA